MSTVAGTVRRRSVVEGSFTRSMLAAGGRGAGLVGLAVLIGIVLLQATDDSATPPGSPVPVAGRSSEVTTTTVAQAGTGQRPPAQVEVLVLNAARVPGAAGTMSEKLQGLGYVTLTPGDAPQQDPTVVYFKPGFEAEADALAPQVGGGAVTEPLPDPSPFAGTDQADLVVVIGKSST